MTAPPLAKKTPVITKAQAPRRPSEEEIRKKDIEEAAKWLQDAHEAEAKKKLDEANRAAEAAATKRKLKEQAEKEKAAAAEAEKMKSAEAKRKASLETVATKNAERKARGAKTQAQVPAKEPAKASTPKQMEPTAPVPVAGQDEAQHSQHQFPDPRDAELWDAKGIIEALWKMGEEEEAVAPENITFHSLSQNWLQI